MSCKNKIHIKTSKTTNWLAGGGLVAGVLSFLGASCCVFTVALISFGLSAKIFYRLSFLNQYQSILHLSAIFLLLGAVIGILASKSQPIRASILFTIGFAFTVAAQFITTFEGRLIQWLG